MVVVKNGLCLHSGRLALDKGDKRQCVSLSSDVPECLKAYFGHLSLFVFLLRHRFLNKTFCF